MHQILKHKGILAGVLSYILLVSPVWLPTIKSWPLGIGVSLIFLYYIYTSAASVPSAPDFRAHLNAPFKTVVIGSILYHTAQLIYPGVAGGFTHRYFLLFMMSLIIGFLASVIVTFVVRKLN